MRICRFWDPCDRINPEDGWRISPLFADSLATDVFLSNLLKLIYLVSWQTADVPCGDLFDQGTTQIAKELTGTPVRAHVH